MHIEKVESKASRPAEPAATPKSVAGQGFRAAGLPAGLPAGLRFAR